MKLRFIIFMTIFVSCNTLPEKQNDFKLQQTKTDKCSEPYSTEASKLKLGDVKNLDVYNGVKYLKLGENKEDYLNCTYCQSITNGIDSCKISNKINFLDKDWDVNAYFIDNKLCRLELIQSETSLTAIFYKLQTIFGKPNLQSLNVIHQEESDGKYTIIATDKREFQPYTETVNEYLNEFKNCIKNRNKSSLDIDISDMNGLNEEYSKNYYDGRPKKVRIKYFTEIGFQCKWESKIILQLNINRTEDLKIGEPSIMGSKNEIESGYMFIPKYETIINIFNNSNTIKQFEKLKIEKSKRLDSLQKEDALKEKKKILKEF